MSLRTLCATRYVTPLREGGSLPAIVEAEDDGLYVLKFRGAGQGPNALVAEVLAGEIARALGLAVPELVLLTLDADLARSEPDPEIQDLIRASVGVNLGLDYLPGAAAFDPLADRPDAALASAIVWFDALVSNVDRTVRNTNMLLWHRTLWLIDHGAALYFHHDVVGGWLLRARSPFAPIRDHVLLPYASEIPAADARLAARLAPDVVQACADRVPDAWLAGDAWPDPGARRAAYVDYLVRRLSGPRVFAVEAARAHALHV